MGWFTQKPVTWELKKGWIVWLCVLCPLFTFIGIWYMGKTAKMGRLMRGLLSVGVFFVFDFLYMCFISYVWKGPINGNLHISDAIGMVLVSSFLVYSMTLITANTKEFLERMHLKEFLVLEWEQYDYLMMINSIKIREIKTIDDFIQELIDWDKRIINTEVSNQILSLIDLLKKVDEIKEGQTELFLERHVFSLSSLLRQFHEVELSKLNSTEIGLIKVKLKDTLDIAINAIKQEILDDIKEKNTVAEIEADIYIASLKNQGLL